MKVTVPMAESHCSPRVYSNWLLQNTWANTNGFPLAFSVLGGKECPQSPEWQLLLPSEYSLPMAFFFFVDNTHDYSYNCFNHAYHGITAFSICCNWILVAFGPREIRQLFQIPFSTRALFFKPTLVPSTLLCFVKAAYTRIHFIYLTMIIHM